jgi:predicted SAM-dependent methyltransferase
VSAGVLEKLKRTEHPAGRHLLLRARGGAHYLARGHLVRRRAVDRYLRTTPNPALHIGAGPKRIDGWLNTDLIAGDTFLNIERPLPFADASFAYAFGEHVIGALAEQAAVSLFQEIHRVLRPGGVLRVATPDLEKLIAIYYDRNQAVQRADYISFFDLLTGKRHETACQLFNDTVRLWGIRYTYDEEDLVRKMREAGFVDVTRVEAEESAHPALAGLERHGPEWLNQAEVLCVEAVRGG